LKDKTFKAFVFYEGNNQGNNFFQDRDS
jgi:hypothetical protein